MTASDIIDALGGSKAVQALTGLSKGRISQWRTGNHIPRSWECFLRSTRPEIFAPGKRAKPERKRAAERAA